MTRNLNVVASCFEPDLSMDADSRRSNFKRHMQELLRKRNPDLVVVPETALFPDLDAQPDCGAEPIDGPTIDLARQLAREFETNICMPIVEKVGEANYNTAVYIDRRGDVAGKYVKHVPTKPEMELGIMPGAVDQDPVILDGLRIGTAICFDENYPCLMWNWIAKDVGLIVFPSYTYGGKLMQAWALMCGVPLVVAFPWEAMIYDRDGSVLAEGGTWTATMRFGHHPAWIGANVNMQSRVYHLDHNQSNIREIEQVYGGKVDVALMVREARCRISVASEDLDIEQLQKDMQLTPLSEYLTSSWSIAECLRGKM